jgi:hypothetical protein
MRRGGVAVRRIPLNQPEPSLRVAAHGQPEAGGVIEEGLRVAPHQLVGPNANRSHAAAPASPGPAPPSAGLRTALTIGVFLIGLLAVTGVELLKGSTLARGETGTSVGRVVDPRPVSADTKSPRRRSRPSPPTRRQSRRQPTTPNSDAQRGVNATTDAPQSGSSNDEGDHDATSPVTPTPRASA